MMIYLLCIIILCLIALIDVTRRRQSKDMPPGPYPWPIFGNIRLMKKLGKKLGGQHKAFLHLTKEYKSNVVSIRLGRSDTIIVCGVDLIRQILRDEDFDGRPWNEFIKLRNMGLRKGITMSDGLEWREMRTWLFHSFKDLGFGRIETVTGITEELEIVLKKLRVQKGATQLKSIIIPVIINVVWKLATGKRFTKELRLRYFIDLMEKRAAAFDMAGGLLSKFPWLRYFAPTLTGYKIMKTVNDEFREFLMEIINEHKDKYVHGQEQDVIDKFLTEMYHGKGPERGFTEDQLMMILIDLLLAGLQITSITLDFLFLYMTVHPEIQCKLQKELDSVIDKDSLPQLSDKAKMPYTEAVITETERLRLPVPIIGPRRTLNDTYLEGYRIPKNSTILINLYSIHMDPNLYKNPEVFDPERFLVDGKFIPDKNLMFFGAGHRRCPGEIVARSAIFLIFAGVMREFQLLPVDSNSIDMNPETGLTISPKPYQVFLVDRNPK